MKNSKWYLTPKEAGALLGCSGRTVRRKVNRGELTGVQTVGGHYWIAKAEIERQTGHLAVLAGKGEEPMKERISERITEMSEDERAEAIAYTEARIANLDRLGHDGVRKLYVALLCTLKDRHAGVLDASEPETEPTAPVKKSESLIDPPRRRRRKLASET